MDIYTLSSVVLSSTPPNCKSIGQVEPISLGFAGMEGRLHPDRTSST